MSKTISVRVAEAIGLDKEFLASGEPLSLLFPCSLVSFVSSTPLNLPGIGSVGFDCLFLRACLPDQLR